MYRVSSWSGESGTSFKLATDVVCTNVCMDAARAEPPWYASSSYGTDHDLHLKWTYGVERRSCVRLQIYFRHQWLVNFIKNYATVKRIIWIIILHPNARLYARCDRSFLLYCLCVPWKTTETELPTSQLLTP